MATWQNKAPSPSKLNPAGQLLPPGPTGGPSAEEGAAAAAGDGKGPAAMAADSSLEEEEFHDAREHLEGGQLAQQAQHGAAAAAMAAAAMAPPPGALHLRTQPDEVQWTNLHDVEPEELLQVTQVGAAPAVLPLVPAASRRCPPVASGVCRGLGLCCRGQLSARTAEQPA